MTRLIPKADRRPRHSPACCPCYHCAGNLTARYSKRELAALSDPLDGDDPYPREERAAMDRLEAAMEAEEWYSLDAEEARVWLAWQRVQSAERELNRARLALGAVLDGLGFSRRRAS